MSQGLSGVFFLSATGQQDILCLRTETHLICQNHPCFLHNARLYDILELDTVSQLLMSTFLNPIPQSREPDFQEGFSDLFFLDCTVLLPKETELISLNLGLFFQILFSFVLINMRR